MALENKVPVMTGYTTPSGVVSASDERTSLANYAWKAFDKSTTSSNYWCNNGVSGGTTGWIQYQFASAETIVQYKMNSAPLVTYAPNTWTLLASNTGAFSGEEVTLDSQSGITWSSTTEVKTFDFTNTNAYLYYRLDITAVNGSSYIMLYELQLMGLAPNVASITGSGSITANFSEYSADITGSGTLTSGGEYVWQYYPQHEDGSGNAGKISGTWSIISDDRLRLGSDGALDSTEPYPSGIDFLVIEVIEVDGVYGDRGPTKMTTDTRDVIGLLNALRSEVLTGNYSTFKIRGGHYKHASDTIDIYEGNETTAVSLIESDYDQKTFSGTWKIEYLAWTPAPIEFDIEVEQSFTSYKATMYVSAPSHTYTELRDFSTDAVLASGFGSVHLQSPTTGYIKTYTVSRGPVTWFKVMDISQNGNTVGAKYVTVNKGHTVTSLYRSFAYMSNEGTNSLLTVSWTGECNATNMRETFYNQRGLTSVTGLDYSKATTCLSMYRLLTTTGRTGLTNIGSNIVFASGADLSFMFHDAKVSPTALVGMDTSLVSNFYSMFASCEINAIPAINTVSGTDFGFMLNSAYITCVEALNTTNKTNTENLFGVNITTPDSATQTLLLSGYNYTGGDCGI